MAKDFITIVSGLPRSGTSMMMQVLEAGGLPALKDDIRVADEDNPKGYYEFERVKQIAQDQAWLQDAQGRVVKMVSALLLQLPPTHTYKVLFMRRKMEEVLASQKAMLSRKGEAPSPVGDDKMAALFRKHLDQVEKWVAEQPNIEVLYVHYNEVLAEPRPQMDKINRFLGSALDVDKMVSVVDRTLYRQRDAKPRMEVK
jgi:hypothetical protein